MMVAAAVTTASQPPQSIGMLLLKPPNGEKSQLLDFLDLVYSYSSKV